MPLENDLNKVLVLGSGPNIVGSVAEMDAYTNSAIKAFLEDDIHVVLVNPNPATVSSDRQKGVTVYLEPMTLAFMKRILRMEEPDAIVTAYGSTNALAVAKELLDDGIIDDMKIKLLTTNKELLNLVDHKKQIAFMQKNNFATSESWHLVKTDTSESIADLLSHARFPLLVTKYHQYIHNEHFKFKNVAELSEFFKTENDTEADHFNLNNYRLTEDLSNWEEVIVDVLRDNRGNFNFINISSCLEDVAINSGDSLIISPALTLNNDHVRKIRKLSKKIMNRLNIHGFLSIHFAVSHHDTEIDLKVLTLKNRLTRTSVIARRVAMYDIGYVLAKIALGYNFNEIVQPLTGQNAAIEPVLDAVSIKFPYFSFSESGLNHYQLGDRMQASGESIGIGRNFEAAFLKGLESNFDINGLRDFYYLGKAKDGQQLLQQLAHPDELHIITLLAAISSGLTYTQIHEVCRLHPLYFEKLSQVIEVGKQLKNELSKEVLVTAKKLGFSNTLISIITQKSLEDIGDLCRNYQLNSSYLLLDGSAGLYRANCSVCYSSFGSENEVSPLKANRKVLVIGMKPMQVSLTSEYDYMIYHALKTLKDEGIATVLISNNSEAVSTAYELVDRVYFEPITFENIKKIAQKEGIDEVLTQFSGKEINQLRPKLINAGLKLLGQENLISELAKQKINVDELPIELVPGEKIYTESQAKNFVEKHGFPVLIGGRTRELKVKSAVVYDIPALEKYINENDIDEGTISRFIEGRKYEVIAISDSHNVTIPGIIEHLEQTGSHASDSIAVFQPQNLNKEQRAFLGKMTKEILPLIQMKGLFTLHFLQADGQFYLLQVKTYAGHNLAFLSKSLNSDLVGITTKCLLGKSLKELNLPETIWPASELIHVKMPVFSYIDYQSGNTFDSKMKSSASVMGRDTLLSKALYKGYEGSNLTIPSYGTIFISVRDEDKQRTINLAQRFHRLGFKLVATEGTATILAEAGITTGIVKKVQEDQHNLLEKIASHKIVMVINVINLSDNASQDAIRIRDVALNTHIPVFSSLQTAELILEVLESLALTTQPI